VHELSLMDDLVRTVMEEVGEARVHVLRIEVGRRAGASPAALRFCFEICTRGTALESAELDIIETMEDELRLKEVEVT
jgi:hydrogenase nickel incorporation protein HypA/HybF